MPARAASSAKSWISSTACWVLGSATTEPALRRRVMSPLAASVDKTLFTVIREQPYSAISSCSKGMRCPGGQSPDMMRASISSRMRWCRCFMPDDQSLRQDAGHSPRITGADCLAVQMPTVPDQGPARDDDRIDGGLARDEDVGIDPAVAGDGGEVRMACIEHDEIRPMPGLDGGNAPAQGAGSAREGIVVEAAPGGLTFARRQNVAGPALQALAVLELLEFAGRRDLDVRVGSDAEKSSGRQMVDALENAVAEIGLGDGAQARHRAAGGDPQNLLRIEMGGVDQAPAPIDRSVIEQPRDGSPAGPCDAILDLLHLLGDVDMDRPGPRMGHDLVQVLGRYRAQAVRRDAYHRIV